jgi:hypothetical protein
MANTLYQVPGVVLEFRRGRVAASRVPGCGGRAVASGERATVGTAARRKQALGGTLVAAVLLGGFAYGIVRKPFGQGPGAVADAGGGPVRPGVAGTAPYAVRTLAPVGVAEQDPSGGEGGAAAPGHQLPPAVLGPVPVPPVPAYQPLGPVLYLSGSNLIDPNRSAVSSGEVSVASSGSGFRSDGQLTGCGVPGAADYYAIPLRNPVSYSGPPRVHARFSGSGPVVITLFEQHPDGRCVEVASGRGTPTAGTLDLTLSGTGHTFAVGMLPGVLISGHGVLRTDAADPSYGVLPGLTGV